MPNCMFYLDQHTPILHFQSDHAGATLRATELKPRLDRFLLTYAKDASQLSDYLIADTQALDYRLKIRPGNSAIIMDGKTLAKSGTLFFDANGNDSQNELAHDACMATDSLALTFLSRHQTVIDLIKSMLPAFLLLNNFGFRNAKGFGSFTVKNSFKNKEDLHFFLKNEIQPLLGSESEFEPALPACSPGKAIRQYLRI